MSIFTYAGTLRVGIAPDLGPVPDPGALVRAFEEEFAEMLAVSAG